MPQQIWIRTPDVSSLAERLKAAQTLGATKVHAEIGGTWIEVKPSGEHGELCFGPVEVIRPIRGKRGRILVRADGEEIVVEPYEGSRDERYLSMTITFG